MTIARGRSTRCSPVYCLDLGQWLLPRTPGKYLIGQRKLFLDDDSIVRIENLERMMRPPQKRGTVVRSDNPTQAIQTGMAPVWDPDAEHFKLCVLKTDEPLRVSSDGQHWMTGPKPYMRIVHPTRDPYDPDPGRRFKASWLNAGFAVSPDAVPWTKLDVPTVPSSDEGNLSYDLREGLFIHSVKRGGPFGPAIVLANSRDFKTWNDHGLVFHVNKRVQELGVEAI